MEKATRECVRNHNAPYKSDTACSNNKHTFYQAI